MGLFSFLDKNKQAMDEEDNPPVKARRSRRTESSEAQEPLDPALPEKRRARRRFLIPSLSLSRMTLPFKFLRAIHQPLDKMRLACRH